MSTFSPRSSRCSTPVALASALTLLTLATTSVADPTPAAETSTDASGYTYRFNDDALKAGGLDHKDARLRVVHHTARDLLIRPRVHFIAEMLKSVENL